MRSGAGAPRRARKRNQSAIPYVRAQGALEIAVGARWRAYEHRRPAAQPERDCALKGADAPRFACGVRVRAFGRRQRPESLWERNSARAGADGPRFAIGARVRAFGRRQCPESPCERDSALTGAGAGSAFPRLRAQVRPDSPSGRDPVRSGAAREQRFPRSGAGAPELQSQRDSALMGADAPRKSLRPPSPRSERPAPSRQQGARQKRCLAGDFWISIRDSPPGRAPAKATRAACGRVKRSHQGAHALLKKRTSPRRKGCKASLQAAMATRSATSCGDTTFCSGANGFAQAVTPGSLRKQWLLGFRGLHEQ